MGGGSSSSQVEVVNDERLLEALPLSYLSLLLTGDFHPCPSALPLISPSLPLPLSLIVLPQESDRFHLHYLARSSFAQLRSRAGITACARLLFLLLRVCSNEARGPCVNSWRLCWGVRGRTGGLGWVAGGGARTHRMPSGYRKAIT